jgi:hypothetical protein
MAGILLALLGRVMLRVSSSSSLSASGTVLAPEMGRARVSG